jgi:hypothetical protein
VGTGGGETDNLRVFHNKGDLVKGGSSFLLPPLGLDGAKYEPRSSIQALIVCGQLKTGSMI